MQVTLKIDENLLMQYFKAKYLEGFRQIANSIDDNSTQYAFIYMLLSRCFKVEKILDACVPKIKDSINSKLEIDGADSKWKEFWSKKKETCECELDKMKSINELLENNRIDSVGYNKMCWKIIKVIGLDIFGLLFNRDIDQALKEAPAFSTAERQMFKRFVIDEDFDVTPKDITSQFIADYQLVYDIEKQKEYWLGVNQLSPKKRKKLKDLFGEK